MPMNNRQKAAIIRWNPRLRRKSLYLKIYELIEAYERDHGHLKFSHDQTYILLSKMGYQTARIPLELAFQLEIDPKLETLD